MVNTVSFHLEVPKLVRFIEAESSSYQGLRERKIQLFLICVEFLGSWRRFLAQHCDYTHCHWIVLIIWEHSYACTPVPPFRD